MILRRSVFVLLIFSLFLTAQAKKYKDSDEYKEYKKFKEYEEFEEFKKWREEKDLNREIEGESKISLEKNEPNSKREFEEEISSTERNKFNRHQREGESNSAERKEFEKLRRRENKSGEENTENQKWRSKKEKENYKNKDFGKRKNYDSDGYDEQTKKKYTKKDAYEKNKSFDKKHQDFEKIIEVAENSNDPPPINEAALMARYIVNQANWTSVATISSRKDIKYFPSANVISFSDGALGNGSGIPYMYLTPLDFTAQDISKDNRASLMMTLAQGHYCSTKNYDPMDPRCARVILTGKIKAVKNDSAEIEIAMKAVFSRHPWLQKMPPNHHFFFAKLKIASIAVLDTFGGPKFVTIEDYLNPPNISSDLSGFKLDESNNVNPQDSEADILNPNTILV